MGTFCSSALSAGEALLVFCFLCNRALSVVALGSTTPVERCRSSTRACQTTTAPSATRKTCSQRARRATRRLLSSGTRTGGWRTRSRQTCARWWCRRTSSAVAGGSARTPSRWPTVTSPCHRCAPPTRPTPERRRWSHCPRRPRFRPTPNHGTSSTACRTLSASTRLGPRPCNGMRKRTLGRRCPRLAARVGRAAKLCRRKPR